jgi:putative tricarboxylic transport membrane protein
VSSPELHRNSERRPDRAALAIAAILLVLAAIVAWDAAHIGGAAQYARIGPQTIPYAIAIGLAGLGLWTIVEALRGEFPEREPQEARPVLWIVGGLLATGLMFGLVARGFGERRLWLSIPAGIVFAAIVWLAFARGLALTLPSGPLEHVLGDLLNTVVAIFRPAPVTAA